MVRKKKLKKIGDRLRHLALGAMLSGLLCVPTISRAEPEVQFSADIDRPQIALDESVSLRLKVTADGTLSVSEPQFAAPEFDEINQYSSTFIESYYENGKFGMRNNHTLTRVLRPRKTGNLRISNIRIQAGGKTFTAPDLTVTVGAAGAGTPPPRNYGGNGVGLRGAGKAGPGRPVLVRAEISKDRAFKGEQVVVSYYLYTRVQLFNINIEKWPSLNGFLREDLETPIMNTSGRLEAEQVVLDGQPYRRSLLVRYAAYPLQEGKLKIDSLSLKYAYYPRQQGGLDEDEDPFTQFFQQLQPRPGQERSELLTLDVTSVPEAGRPDSFTGGVGDFSLAAAIDRTEVKVNEPVTMTLKVEGRGNVAAIGEPRAKWPEQVELYDTKGRAKTGKGGVGEKIFEFLLIPRSPGPLPLPKLEMSFFDPAKKAYVTRSTEPVTLNVLPGQGGAAPDPRPTARTENSGNTAQSPRKEELRYLKSPTRELRSAWPLWRVLYWGAIGVLGAFALLVGWDLVRAGKGRAQAALQAKAKAHSRSWDKLKAEARLATSSGPDRLPWKDVVDGYERMASFIFDSLDRAFPIGVRSISRKELKQLLISEHSFPEAVWERIEKILEYAETVQFAASAGVISEDAARQAFSQWLDEARSVVRLIEERFTRQ